MRKFVVPTKQVKALNEALKERKIKTKLEHSDKHKHVDIAILGTNIYIEIDGLHHYTDSRQIEKDFKRDYYSTREGYNTIHIPNELIDKHLDKIANAICKVAIKIKRF
ncbi:MAG: DUF559 domain-containing protein [bacterium]